MNTDIASNGSGVTAFQRTSYGAPPEVRKNDPLRIRLVIQARLDSRSLKPISPEMVQATNGSLTEGSGNVSPWGGRAMIQAFRSRHASPRPWNKLLPPTKRSKPSADVVSGTNIANA